LLADLVLPIIGEGFLLSPDGLCLKAETILKEHNYTAIELIEKEGLSLINGTQVSTALALESLLEIKDLFLGISAAGAFTTEVMLGTDAAFRDEIQMARNQVGQSYAGRLLFHLMKNSGYREAHIHCDRVQDFYSIRCMPQVHGSLYDLINFSEQILFVQF